MRWPPCKARSGPPAVPARGPRSSARRPTTPWRRWGRLPAQLDTERLFAAIDHDLDLAEARYRAGDVAGAREALIDAYLENFEDLEPPLVDAAPDLKERLEHTLRDGLRSLAAQGVSPDRFEAAVENTRADLERAREALQ